MMAEMKRITVTLPDQMAEALEDWATQQGRPTANLASFLIEQGIIQAQEKGQYSPRPSKATASSK
jgi:metal-responsive CopG/Arc/MetJ family transcriptional regulator